MTKHLITSALPYANGPIHLGHLIEYIQTDIYARFRRSVGDDIIYVCADDAHGTGIELNARRMGITPEELIDNSYKEHTRDFDGFHVKFDIFASTNTPENKARAEDIYAKLKLGGHVVRKEISQMYSESMGRFLPDRWVKGTCPRCHTPDQYGDGCEVCNAQYEPTDLIDPVDAIEGKTPVLRNTSQLYVKLSDFSDALEGWLKRGVPQSAIRNFVKTWLDGGLNDWCISRDAPYFGFEIPNEPGKYFYVWLDAPIGYVSSTERYCDANGGDWRDYWTKDADATVTHVIGKDIVYFHTLFWPAMLTAANLKLPDRVQVHGFLTVNGQKMSKSRGTFIRASTYLEHLDPEYLRFYYASKLSNNVDDLDLNFEDFVSRVNGSLVNNVVNLCNRVTKFLSSRLDGKLAEVSPESQIATSVADALPEIKAFYSNFDYRDAIRRITELSDEINVFFQEAQPWAVMREDVEHARTICSEALHGACALMAALTPVTPKLVGRFAASLGLETIGWEQAERTWQPEAVLTPERLMDRIDPADVEAMQLASIEEAVVPPPEDAVEVESFKPEITFDDFSKLDLRVGLVEAANEVKGAKKLLQLTVFCGKRLNIFAGVRKAYPDPEVLVGRRVLVVANLKPRKMRFGISEGMLLCSSGEKDKGLKLVHPDEEAFGGWPVN